MTGHEAIYIALGKASMCWSETPTGIFDSVAATTVGQELEELLGKPSLGEKVTGETSDGYHTFGELYDHRMALTALLVKVMPGVSWRSKQHYPSDDPMFDGFFIVGLDLSTGPITYHYKLVYWDLFDGVRIIEQGRKWDGHTPADVVKRLIEAAKAL